MISPALRGRLAKLLLIPVVLILIACLVGIAPYSKYTRGLYEFLVFLLIVDLAVACRGMWRDAGTFIATLAFGLAVLELGCAAVEPINTSVESKGFSKSQPVLGWGPSAPGLYHGSRTGPGGAMVYNADYTIDDNLLRRTTSASTGPSTAFFGDSMTFGQGLSDAEPLPQAFADLAGRKMRVLNFGFPGYGPQQFLRPLETGLFDPLLADTKVFIYETAAWHAERSSCLAGHMVRAARYEMRDGKLTYVGDCAEGMNRVLREIFVNGAAYRRFVQPFANALGPKDIELYIAELQRSAELIKQKYDARLIVLYLSEGDDYLSKTGFTDATIVQGLKQAGIDVVDATLKPKDFPPGTEFRIPGDGHPTAVANRARAALLQNFLARRGTTVAAGRDVQ
jgi:hypothetical protein